MNGPLADRFWPKVDKTGECWVWTGAMTTSGYGQLTIRKGGGFGRAVATHVAWFLEHGEWPRDAFVLHRCDNPPCVRPDHLFLGGPLDNVRDMIAKGRQNYGARVRGEAVPTARLNEGTVAEIRRRYAVGERQAELAAEYGVRQTNISAIVNRRTWKHVP